MLTLRTDFMNLVERELGTQAAAERADQERAETKQERAAQEAIRTAPLRAMATLLHTRLEEIKTLLDAHGVGGKLSKIDLQRTTDDRLYVAFSLNDGRGNEWSERRFSVNAVFPADVKSHRTPKPSGSVPVFSAEYEYEVTNHDGDKRNEWGGAREHLGQDVFETAHDLVKVIFTKTIAGADNKKLARLKLAMGGG
jgi:hypothetical protein